jgi:hypothetical protein
MHPALRFVTRPDVRLPLAGTLVAGLLIGFVVGVFTVRGPEERHLLRQISESVTNHSCSGWAEDAEREERKDEVYRAVGQALTDWQRANQRASGS